MDWRGGQVELVNSGAPLLMHPGAAGFARGMWARGRTARACVGAQARACGARKRECVRSRARARTGACGAGGARARVRPRPCGSGGPRRAARGGQCAGGARAHSRGAGGARARLRRAREVGGRPSALAEKGSPPSFSSFWRRSGAIRAPPVHRAYAPTPECTLHGPSQGHAGSTPRRVARAPPTLHEVKHGEGRRAAPGRSSRAGRHSRPSAGSRGVLRGWGEAPRGGGRAHGTRIGGWSVPGRGSSNKLRFATCPDNLRSEVGRRGMKHNFGGG